MVISAVGEDHHNLSPRFAKRFFQPHLFFAGKILNPFSAARLYRGRTLPQTPNSREGFLQPPPPNFYFCDVSSFQPLPRFAGDSPPPATSRKDTLKPLPKNFAFVEDHLSNPSPALRGRIEEGAESADLTGKSKRVVFSPSPQCPPTPWEGSLSVTPPTSWEERS